MKLRKNPVWIPIAIVAGVLAAGAGTMWYLNASLLEEMYSPDKIEEALKGLIAELRKGNQLEPAIMKANPNTMVLAPATERVALLQAAWWTMKAAASTVPPNQDIVGVADLYLVRSQSASQDATISPSDPKITQPLEDAAQYLSQFGAGMSPYIQKLLVNTKEAQIADTQKELAKRAPSKAVYDATVKTGSDILQPFEVLAGLLTGQKPRGMDERTWKIVKYSLYGGIALGVTGYTLSQVRAIAEAVKGDE